MRDLNTAWLQHVEQIMAFGDETAPRGYRTRELLGKQLVFDINRPVLTLTERKLGYKFMCAEAAWILSGDNKVASIAPFSKEISRFSDDGHFFFGAYGPKIVDQLSHVVSSLLRDPDSRQAFINIWRENPPGTRDVPCTVSLQFLIRAGTLHVVTTMRSSDAWLGVPYDAFTQAMLGCYVLALYRRRGGTAAGRLGRVILNAASAHVYEEQWSDALRTIAVGQQLLPKFEYAPLDPSEFWDDPHSLVVHLWLLANKVPAQHVNRRWLRELLPKE
jgi:thymidylate synthase